MAAMLLSFLLGFMPLVQQQSGTLQFDNRTRQNLLLGRGEKTGAEYYDVVITNQPTSGVFIKLPYTKKGGKFTFDLHHRIAMTKDFALPAEVTTIVEVVSGAANSLGVYTLTTNVNAGDSFDEAIVKTSRAEIDKFVTPLTRKTVTIKTIPGPQSVGIVGRTVTITRGAFTSRIDTPGARIATVSNFKFEEAQEGVRLTVD